MNVVSYGIDLFLQELKDKIDEENRVNAEIESYLRTHTDVSIFASVTYLFMMLKCCFNIFYYNI